MENKTSKYFKYAIGEIILVVIGILIALQINNWNEHKKERIIEKKILKELLVDLEVSKADLENDLKVNKKYIKISETIKNHLYQKKPNHDSINIQVMLTQAAIITQFTPRTSGYKNLNSIGLNIITNDSLRKVITNTFERYFENAKHIGRDFNKIENSNVDLTPFFIKHLEIDNENDYKYSFPSIDYSHTTNFFKVRNYKALLNDKKFLFMIQKTIYDRADKINFYGLTVKRIDFVSKFIKKELKQLEND